MSDLDDMTMVDELGQCRACGRLVGDSGVYECAEVVELAEGYDS